MQTTMPKRAVSLMAAATLALAVLVGAPTAARADGTTWTLQTTPVDNAWYSVAHGNGLWVAVSLSGSGDRVMTSPDGMTWTSRTSAEDNTWESVAFGNGTWVAVASDGSNRVMTSPDGITWTARNVPLNEWRSVAYGGGVWVAVASTGTGDRVMTSTDNGATWNSRTSPSDEYWFSMAYGNGRWIAVAQDSGKVMTSTDGINWSIVAGAPVSTWNSIAYGNGLWVALSSTTVMVSADGGANWASFALAIANDWRSVAYGNGLWVAVSRTGSGNRVMTSPDAVNWTSQASAADHEWRSVAYGDGAWVAVANSGVGGRVMTSGATPASSVSQAAPTPPSLSCAPTPVVVDAPVACSVTGGDPDIDILWRAAHAQPFAARGVTLDDAGTGEFTFLVPAAARGRELTVELVEWIAPLSLGVVGGPVPTSVPSGEGPAVPGWLAVVGMLAAAVAMGAARRGQAVTG